MDNPNTEVILSDIWNSIVVVDGKIDTFISKNFKEIYFVIFAP